MSQKDVEFLIEQIIEDSKAGYLVERARWRKEADKKAPGEDSLGRSNLAYAKNADGINIAMTKPNMVKSNNSAMSIMQQSKDGNDKQRTGMWKHIIAAALRNSLDNNQYSPEAVAKELSVEANNSAYTATITPQSVVKLCKQYIQSALHIVNDGKKEYKDKPAAKLRWNQRPELHKKGVLMLAKTVNSPEFLKALKKLFGRRLMDPSSWFKSVEKPNTEGRFSDV